MEADVVIVPEKQKNRCVDNALLSLSKIKTGDYQDEAVKKNLLLFFDALLKLPFVFQISKSEKWLDIMSKKTGKKISYAAAKNIYSGEREKKALCYIVSISKKTPVFDEEIKRVRKKINTDRKEIRRILKRLDKKKYDVLIKKFGGFVMLRIEGY